jgi:hypothetical protein
LSLIRIAAIIRAMQNLVHVVDKGRAPKGRVVPGYSLSADDHVIVKAVVGIGSGGIFLLDPSDQSFRQGFVIWHDLTSLKWGIGCTASLQGNRNIIL